MLPKVKLIVNHTRKPLSEGRSRGLGFGFAKPKGDDFETAMPISPCKDYLNDAVWLENTSEKEVQNFSACGFAYVRQNLWKEKSFAYLAAQVCKNTKNEEMYTEWPAEVRALNTNADNIVKLLNHVEDTLKVEGRTEIYPTLDETIFILKVPVFWVQYSYLISMYTLLVRLGQFYSGSPEPKEYLDTLPTTTDYNRFNSTWIPNAKKYHYMIEHGILKPDLSNYKGANGTGIHGYGFNAVQIPLDSKLYKPATPTVAAAPVTVCGF